VGYSVPGQPAPTPPGGDRAASPDDVSDFVHQVARFGRDVTAALASALDEHQAAIGRYGENVSALLQRAGTAVPDLDPQADPFGPRTLDPLVAAQAGRRDAAARAARDGAEAEAQIPLDAALSAGRARLGAVDTVRAQLTEAKFLGHLIARRTRALLAVAGDLFGELSGGRYGFGADFRVVSLSTGAARDPKTLSGGETFLASLALALGLVELHGRGGPHLGALFLDEGFGSLDTATLDTALSVLRKQAGGERLVVVISHLHAVAEAVDDVLWVERGPAGSAARWLSPADRDALIQREFQAGLLSLA
jgi:exonuclease SbcC